MKNWKQQHKLIFLTTIILLVPLLIGYLQYFIIGYTSWFPQLDYLPLGRLFLGFGAVELILSYLLYDSYVAYYRHQSKNFSDVLPEKEKNIAQLRRDPLLISGLITLGLALINSFLFSF